uniref:Uncharacterized protein n=1 Tax=Leersia perrieri TaxID=77586 RepID=A0A0D9WVN6_9ORYZ
MAFSSPLVLTILLFASLTGLIVLAPLSSSPLPPPAKSAPPVVGDFVSNKVAGDSSTVVAGVDDEEDLALFRRATLDSSGEPAMTSLPPKVAFLFLTNSDLTFAPLWEKFFAGNADKLTVYIHADPSSSNLHLPPTKSFCGRFVVAAKPTRRADATLIAAARRLLAAAIVDDRANSYFILLSQHCVPIHSFRHLHAVLFPQPNPSSSSPARKSRNPISYIEVLDGEPQLRARYEAIGGEAAMLPELPFPKFRVGSQFFELSRRHAALVGHPHAYGAAEISPELVAGLRRRWREVNATVDYMFARKFKPDCLAPLMAIADTELIFAEAVAILFVCTLRSSEFSTLLPCTCPDAWCNQSV